ncbi:MAG TPA: HAD-IA family hydrolase [Bryobacteraceae bacterium]|jgi:putative hydrolase of the HAD superfamily|nr:HAD-IA family hydrolase [Bryobacteraceae bacterium]
MAGSRFFALYTDIGGVLGTNGWDSDLRKRACSHFHIDFHSVESRHHLMFDTYERGFMSFEDYLRHVFFASPRSFTIEQLRDYTYDQSIAWPENIEFFRRVKKANRLKLGLISNEGRGITEHRIGKFGLRQLADFLVISHFVHLRKPDHEIWRLALNLAQAKPEESIYVDDREMFVAVARELGFTAVHHTSLESTNQQFQELGLLVE